MSYKTMEVASEQHTLEKENKHGQARTN